MEKLVGKVTYVRIPKLGKKIANCCWVILRNQ